MSMNSAATAQYQIVRMAHKGTFDQFRKSKNSWDDARYSNKKTFKNRNYLLLRLLNRKRMKIKIQHNDPLVNIWCGIGPRYGEALGTPLSRVARYKCSSGRFLGIGRSIHFPQVREKGKERLSLKSNARSLHF